MKLLSEERKNDVLTSMMLILDTRRADILKANAKDTDAFDPNDRAMYDRLIVNDKKIDGMIEAVEFVRDRPDPIGKVRSEYTHPNGMQVINKTAPFGTIMIIYESRPDVTVEAAVIAFKSNNRILLKGGKEARHSNEVLVDCWHQALKDNDLSKDWIQMLSFSREETQEFLRHPDQPVDLIVPRGGEGLIRFVKQHASCAVLVSGRGNNFVYVHDDADWQKAKKVIIRSKIDKISACNALDKVLINRGLPDLKEKLNDLIGSLKESGVEVLLDGAAVKLSNEAAEIKGEDIWYEEFLTMKIVIGLAEDIDAAIDKINTYSGGHSVTIMTRNDSIASRFMEEIDAAAVYHNASTRFTDGGQFGTGAELAISTDKLHHRGPLALDQLVTNKYYIYGDGQVRD